MPAAKSKSVPTEATSQTETNEIIQFHKVAPYPIAISITKKDTPNPLRANIVKLTELGFLMKADASQFYKVGENHSVRFELPAVGKSVACEVKVVKTYDAMEIAGKAQSKLHTVEMHFRNLGPTERASINSYLLQSGQKK